MSSTFVDNNYRSIAGQTGVEDREPETLITDSTIDDTLKISNSSEIVLANKNIGNRGEDCVDIVRGRQIICQDFVLAPFGRNGITVKGASSDVFFTGLSIQRHGQITDIELGQFDNYWYPGRPPTKECTFFGRGMPFDGDRVRVTVWDAEVSEEDFQFDSGVKITRVSRWIWYPYFIFQYTRIRAENLIRRFRGLELIKTS